MDQAQQGTGGAAHVLAKLYNESTYDDARGNTEFTVLASAARTATTNSNDIVNYNSRGLIIFFNVTAVPGVDTVAIRLELKDPVSGAYKLQFSGAAQVAAGLTTYYCYPGASDSGQFTARISAPLSRTSRIQVVHSGAGAFTYSVGGILLL